MRKNMKMQRTIIPVAIIGILLSLSLAPVAYSSGGYEEEKTVGIVVVTDEGSEIVYVTMNSTNAKELEESMNNFMYWCMDNKPLSDLELDVSEKTLIRGMLENILDVLPEEFANINIINLDEVMDLLTPQPASYIRTRNSVISFGWGHSLIPFYIYEAFIRLAIPFIRPIRILHFAGFTGYIDVIPPEIEYDFERDFHFLTTRCFQGLYIDAGSLITKRLIGGPILLVGRAHVSTLGFWR